LIDPSGYDRKLCVIERCTGFDRINKCGSDGKLWEPNAEVALTHTLINMQPAEQWVAMAVLSAPATRRLTWRERLANWWRRLFNG